MFDSTLQQLRALRTTVLSAIVEQFGFNAGDRLEWGLKAENGQLVILVKPLTER
jgi:hypothetical protein